jgi:hypothetical protein
MRRGERGNNYGQCPRAQVELVSRKTLGVCTEVVKLCFRQSFRRIYLPSLSDQQTPARLRNRVNVYLSKAINLILDR